MNTEFCMECGTQYQYSLKKPNFCSSCGGKLSEEAQATQQPVVSSEKEVESPPTISRISKLEYEIQRSGPTVTFGDLVSQAAQDPNKEYNPLGGRPKATPPKGYDVQKQILKECQSAREPKDVSE